MFGHGQNSSYLRCPHECICFKTKEYAVAGVTTDVTVGDNPTAAAETATNLAAFMKQN